MRYDEFRDQLQDALREAGLFLERVDHRIETIDLSTTGRRWKTFVWRSPPQRAEPFHVSAKIAFEWSPFNTARSYTCEEDLLTELLGRKRPTKTERRWVRVDLVLHASLPYGSTTPMLESQVLGSWTGSVGEKLDKLLTEFKERQGRVVAVMGGREEVEVEARCKEGVLSLKGMAVSGFWIVRVPRVWDDPDRRQAEKDIGGELARLAQRFKGALDEWTGSVAELATWMRYSPPPPEAKPVEPRLEDEDEDEDGGPETTH